MTGQPPVRVVIAGGGTAGHVEPALAIADAVRAQRPDAVVTLMGTPAGLENRLVPARGYPLVTVPKVPLPRRPSMDLLSLPLRLRGAVRAARAILRDTQADVVVGVGGYAALPAYLAARRLKVPVVVHEANPLPGLANRVGARGAVAVLVAQKGTPMTGARLVGMPLRASVSELGDPAVKAARRDEVRASLGLDDRPVLLVTGGSQGARRLNLAVTAAAAPLAAAGVQVVHITGPANEADVAAALPTTPAGHVRLAYTDDMPGCYAAADLILCRSGAMTCAEIAAAGVPSVLVPLPIGNGEQALNAAALVQVGAAVTTADADVDAAWLVASVLPLLQDPARLAAMSTAARSAAPTDAAAEIARVVLAAAAGGGRAPAGTLDA